MKVKLSAYCSSNVSLTTYSDKKLHSFLKEVNSINQNIQFTMNHTSIPGEDPVNQCTCEKQKSVSFLDTLCHIQNGQIETTLYRKPTDRNQYLMPSSCHPRQTTKSIPYSLATRIIRICSNPQDRNKELEILKQNLLERDYKIETIERAIEKAKLIPRFQLLKPKTQKENNDGPVFASSLDPSPQSRQHRQTEQV